MFNSGHRNLCCSKFVTPFNIRSFSEDCKVREAIITSFKTVKFGERLINYNHNDKELFIRTNCYIFHNPNFDFLSNYGNFKYQSIFGSCFVIVHVT